MDRLHALYQHWSWLPHFRAIAETEHLGEAAKMLRITPPALSRALSHLESTIGTRLFDRRDRRLVLNSAGTALLGAMRLAMRQIDDALAAVAGTRQPVEVKITAPAPYFGAVVLPALIRVRPRWTELSGRLIDMPSSVVAALVSGELDVCLHEHAIADPDVLSESICKLQKVVSCAPGHPAARRRRLRPHDVLAYEFVAPPASRDGIRDDGWPSDVARRVGLTVANMQLGVDAARTGKYLALLPRPIATGSGLIPLAITGLAITETSIYASRRKPLASSSDVTDRVVGLLREELARLDRRR